MLEARKRLEEEIEAQFKICDSEMLADNFREYQSQSDYRDILWMKYKLKYGSGKEGDK